MGAKAVVFGGSGQYDRAMHSAHITTPAGVFQARFTSRGLAGLAFPTGRRVASEKTTATPLPARTERWRRAVQRALLAVLAGRPVAKPLPLDLSAGTPFQQQVWASLAEIPRGETRTYSQIAAAIGRPRAARAVGRACGANPILVLIPCHRVLAARGGLGGFSAGLKWKRFLLEGERSGGDGSTRSLHSDQPILRRARPQARLQLRSADGGRLRDLRAKGR